MLKIIRPKHVTSPVAPLFEWIHHALVRVAPELESEINEVLVGLTLELIDAPEWICSATIRTRTFRISTRVVEILWAQAYAAFVLYDRVGSAMPVEGDVVPLDDPEVREALQIYSWAMDRMIDNGSAAWPGGLPAPSHTSLSTDVAGAYDVARELALVATGFLLLHEVAHIHLKHTPNSASEWSIDEERDADAWAADWILVRGHAPLDQLDKRAMGMAMAALVIVSRGIQTGWMNGVTHPRDFDRLYNMFAHRIPTDLDRVWWMITLVLSLHLGAKNVLPEHFGPFDTAFDAADAMIDHLAKVYERRS